MSDAAQVDPAAIDEVARALVRYGTAEEALMAQVDNAITQAETQANAEQARRRAELSAAEAALRACQSKERADCSRPAQEVRKAKARLDAANQAARNISTAAARYQAVKAKHKATVQALVQNGRAHLSRKSQHLSAYLEAGGQMARRALSIGAVGAQLAVSAVDVSKLAGNVSQGYLPTAEHFSTTSEMTENQTEGAQQLWRDNEEHRHDEDRP